MTKDLILSSTVPVLQPHCWGWVSGADRKAGERRWNWAGQGRMRGGQALQGREWQQMLPLNPIPLPNHGAQRESPQFCSYYITGADTSNPSQLQGTNVPLPHRDLLLFSWPCIIQRRPFWPCCTAGQWGSFGLGREPVLVPKPGQAETDLDDLSHSAAGCHQILRYFFPKKGRLETNQ